MTTKKIIPETESVEKSMDEKGIPPVVRPIKVKTTLPLAEDAKAIHPVDVSSKDAAITPPADPPGKFHTFLHGRVIWFAGAIIIIIAGVFGYNWAFGKAKVVYTTAAVELGDVENTVLAAGLIQPIKYVDVGAQTSGKLKSLKVNKGDKVELGQLLAEIDPVLAKTALTASNASLENMTSQRSQKEAQLVLAKLQRDRNDLLFSHQVISANERDITTAAYNVAYADSASLAAQMKQANASVNTSKANLGYTQITATMSGEVVSITALEGQTLNANQSAPVILRIANLDTVTVWAQVSEADIDRVKLGQDVYFTVLGQTKHWDGKVRQILPTPELINNVVFYDVLFDIPNPKGDLYIQMTAQVFIVLEQAKGVLLIPTAVVGNASEGDEIQVQVMKTDQSIEVRTIKIGIKGEITTEVKEGLKEKELVVISEPKAKNTTANKSALSARKGL
jgi:macrolide-specific efflux system membrane fusion protein